MHILDPPQHIVLFTRPAVLYIKNTQRYVLRIACTIGFPSALTGRYAVPYVPDDPRVGLLPHLGRPPLHIDALSSLLVP